MPPKHAANSSRPSGRTFLANARNSAKRHNPTTSIYPPPPTTAAAAAAVIPPPSADSAKGRFIRTSNSERALRKLPHATVPPHTQPQTLRETLIANSGPEKSDLGNKGAEPGSSMEFQKPSIEQSYISTVPEIGSPLENGGSVTPLTGADGVAGPGNGKRKVVKKVVRIVKKVIKKRVPKRILKNDSENPGLESEVGTNISSFSNGEIANSDCVDEVIKKPSIVNVSKEIPNTRGGISLDLVNDNVIEKSNRVDGVTEDTSIITGITNSACESKLDFGVNAPELLVPTNYQSGMSNAVKTHVHDSSEFEKINSIADNVTKEETAGSVAKNQAKDSVLENQNTWIMNKCEVLDGVTNRSTLWERPESAPVEGENAGIKVNEGLILSGETEALERKKWQKTEIFVGGLDGNIKEDDLRKVFKEAGVILNVKLVMTSNSGRNRGHAFVRFSTDSEARNAVAKYSNVEICGKMCNVAPVGDNDTIFLSKIDRNWKTEDVVVFLEKADIEKINRVTLKADPKNVERNRGFAFVEFETSKYAQAAFNKLQKEDEFGKKPSVKVEWAQPLIGPDEEGLSKVKCVYAEYLPSSWDEQMVKEYFKRFGEIEYVVLSKDLIYSKRKDFAFIHYKNRDAALRCIESVSREISEGHSSKFKIAVSLAYPSKQKKLMANQTSKQTPKPKPKAIRTSKKLPKHVHERKPISGSYNDVKIDNEPSTTDELLQILRQQASNAKHMDPRLHHRTVGSNATELHFPIPGSKRPFSHVGYESYDPINAEPHRLPRARVESSYPNLGPSSSSYGVELSSVPPYYYSQQRLGFTTEPVIERGYPGHFQGREQAPHYRDNRMYRRY